MLRELLYRVGQRRRSRALRRRQSWYSTAAGVAAVLVLALAIPGTGTAATPVPSWTMDCSLDLDPAGCERLTYIAENEGTGVALSDGDQNRLDLIWWGVWLAPGLALGLWIGGRAWRHYRGWA